MTRFATALLVAFVTGGILGSPGCAQEECLGGCGGDGWGSPQVKLENQSGDGGINAENPEPCEINLAFGSVAVGQRETAVVQIYNVGSGILDISIGPQDLGSAFDIDESLLRPIQPGDFYSFAVSFEPLGAGTAGSTLTIQTDGSNPTCPNGATNAVVTMGLSGTGM